MIQDPIYERAYSSYLEGDYESALNDIGICIQKYRKSTYHQRSTKNELYTNLVFAKLLEGKILLASGRISEAEDVYSQLKGELIGSDKTTTGLKGQLYSYLAEIAKSQQKWKDYLKHVLQAKEHLLAADNYSETVDLLFTMEDYFSQKGDDDRLIDLYQQILQTNKSIQSKELRRINSAKVRYQIGKILQRTDLKQATKSLQQAHKDYSKLNFPEMKAKTLIEIAKMKSYENPKDGLKLLKKSQNEFKNLEALEPIISIRMAISYLEMGKQEDAFKIGNHILNDVKKADVSKEYVDNLLDFVKVLILQGNSKDIMNLATKGAQIAGEIYDAHDNREGKIMSSVFDEIAVYIRDGRQSDDSK